VTNPRRCADGGRRYTIAVMSLPRRRRAELLRTPWREAEFCAVDLETTGLDLHSDQVVSYGTVLIQEGRLCGNTATYSLVRPSCRVSPESIRVHALRPADLETAPPVATAVEAISALLEGRVLLAHAAWIEKAFLQRSFRASGLKFVAPIVDTAAIARSLGYRPRASGAEPSLEWLCVTLGLPVHQPHHALGDAMTAAGLFLALAAHLERGTAMTVGDLVRLSR
jgi:DNA polymerase-3 subunit epsilon